jgi:sugar lactone lactonase YvrE
MSRLTTLVLAVPALVLSMAASSPFPDSVPLPNDFSPEGISVGAGSTFYVGSLADGDIYRGDLRSGRGAVFIDAPPGREAGGLKVDQPHHRLFVAGALTGHGYVYDLQSGTPLADFAFGPAGTLFINDVVVTKGGAYFTDSVNPVLYKIPIAPNGALGAPQTITLSGPASTTLGIFNLNGIEATPNGDTLIVAHTPLGALFTVDPRTGASREITLTGGALVPGTPDGLLLDGHTIWVVQNFANQVAEIQLSPDLSTGRVVDQITNPDVRGRFRIPTTLAEHGDRLAIVNSRFDLGLPPPLGTGVPPGTDYDVVLVRKS